MPADCREGRASMARDELPDVGKFDVMTSSVTRSTTSSALDHVDLEAEKKRKEELSYKCNHSFNGGVDAPACTSQYSLLAYSYTVMIVRSGFHFRRADYCIGSTCSDTRRSFPARGEPEGGRAVRFFVRSLGWVEIAEGELTPERSSRAVNKCIVDLSLGRNDLLDHVGRWGDGKDLFMDLDEGALKLIDPESLTTLHTQPIHTIRVWGVGRDNGRDFAYVARDRVTRKHMCHVFRCDAPARAIANTLRDICKRIMIERSLQPPPRPTDLPAARRPRPLSGASFPTPMEEPRKTVRARYLGSAQVPRATGIDVLNDALERLAAARAPSAWRPVAVAVAPSMITITEEGESTPIVECRVRYLSFLGIGRDVRRCAFIVHTAQDQFVAHAFHAEPSSGALCKTIEAACKVTAMRRHTLKRTGLLPLDCHREHRVKRLVPSAAPVHMTNSDSAPRSAYAMQYL
ncbi:Protein Fe65 homolog [Eumeta japonica]|uniref:Protein Fe65 homolog n=1 Tax=Eumeta variegata TaxID=151549 RepID=A0A4C1ZDJ9_EUMVA|nr:Protein Fe65 homolog [Eumeta japonica]